MTKREYLASLDQYLVTMSVSEKAKIILEYEEHFRKGLEAGKTESQISASLGSPYDVASEFLAGRRPAVPSYPSQPRTQTSPSHPQGTQPRTQTSPSHSQGTQPRTQTSPSHPQGTQPRTQTSPSHPQGTQPRTQTSSSHPQGTQPRTQTSSSHPQGTQPRTQESVSYSRQSYAQNDYPSQTYSQPDYAEQTFGQTGYSQSDYSREAAYSQPDFAQPSGYSRPEYQRQEPVRTETSSSYAAENHARTSGYVDYDRAAAEEPLPKKKKKERNFNTTGLIIVIVLCVILIPTLGGALIALLAGLYSLIVAFPTTGIALIAAGGALSAKSLWVCLGLILIGISFLALTGLIVMAAIEGTKLIIKLIRYVYKECKKMIKEGSF